MSQSTLSSTNDLSTKEITALFPRYSRQVTTLNVIFKLSVLSEFLERKRWLINGNKWHKMIDLKSFIFYGRQKAYRVSNSRLEL